MRWGKADAVEAACAVAGTGETRGEDRFDGVDAARGRAQFVRAAGREGVVVGGEEWVVVEGGLVGEEVGREEVF